MPPTDPSVQAALDKEDPVALANAASSADLDHLKAAEALIEARFQRKRRNNRFGIASQILVGWVALAGLGVNAYQSFANKQQAQQQSQKDQDRWSKEFERAQQSDKYRAFFETSVLVTDTSNKDKQLVGYALLQEFVADKTYNSKATLMLEESLAEVLRSNTDDGIDESHRNAVTAILTALSETDDCHALQRAALSIDKLAKRHAKVDDDVEAAEVFNVYVRALVGRAAQICNTMKDFRAVRRPVRDTLIKIPAIAKLKGNVTPAQANTRVAELLRDSCVEEMNVSGATDCSEIFQRYVKLCEQAAASKDPVDVKEVKNETAGCKIIKDVMGVQAVPTSVPKPDDDGGTAH